MRSKAPLALMEQLVMLLVFAMAAALCLRAFALSDQISRQGEVRDQAVLQVQNMAETLKSCGGDYEKAATLLGGRWDGAQWEWQLSPASAYSARAVPEESREPLLGKARVTAFSADGTCLFTLSVAWQEEAAYG